MVQNKSISSPLKRITILDSLRGFALLGVILMHMIQHFGIFSIPSQSGTLRFPELDQAVQWIGNNIIMGRFINIFALLFGLSFFIQMDRAAKKGIDFRIRFVWRMILLLVMGLLSHSFYSVEIISVYGFFGLLMLPLYRVKNWMLITIVAFLLLGGPRIIQTINHNHKLATEQSDTEEHLNNGQDPGNTPEHISNPSFLNSAKHNYQERLPGKLNYQFSYIGRGYLTFALFLIGLLLGRNRFFENLDKRRKRNIILFVCFVMATVLITLLQKLFPPLNIFIFFRSEGQHITASTLIVKALEDISLVSFTGALTMGFILLYNTNKLRNHLDVLAPYGRTALTNYIMQGAIGCLIFSQWAFGSFFSYWGVSALFILGIVIYIVQITGSKLWLKYFLYGPLEWLWRSLTYLEVQPFRKLK